MFDSKYVVDMRKGMILDDIEFKLCEHSRDGMVHCVPYRGGWVAVDNGYHECPNIICRRQALMWETYIGPNG